ncbi:hypothetical protein ACH518_01575 [Methylomonas sp. HW2-6]|uniref:hypothetical protein n=1 Tax=Methylomonas sp. HW2-6 TaxID=3376687 RepID=UPI0040428FEB
MYPRIAIGFMAGKNCALSLTVLILAHAVVTAKFGICPLFLGTKHRLINRAIKSMNCHREFDMPQIEANNLKTQDIAAIESALVNTPEAHLTRQDTL